MMVNDRVRRLVVLNETKEPVGVISLDDLALFNRGSDTAGRVLSNILQDRRPERGPALTAKENGS
jgi:hypothetical protein